MAINVLQALKFGVRVMSPRPLVVISPLPRTNVR